ncbi:MAG: hypothetical protein E6Q87_04230 [Cellvibrionales bacterium]|nr:MAG: hypothetical protein E6Q87_04230 [Cellvibrionales bacterium]
MRQMLEAQANCKQNTHSFRISFFVSSPSPFTWFARMWRWFTHIGRDSIIYPTAERIRMFALGNVLGVLGLLAYYAVVGASLGIWIAQSLVLILVVALWILSRRHPYGRFPHVGFYGLVIWYTMAMCNAWCYIEDDYSRFRLVILLITVSTYYLMAEWWHVLWGALLTLLCCYGLAYFFKWPPQYPQQGDFVILLSTHVAWLGFSLSGHSKREARLRDTQSLVRYIQRGLQPGLQSLGAIMPELRYALAEAAPAAGASPTAEAGRPQAIAQRLQSNTIAMEDYLDLQCVNACYPTLEGRLQLLHAASLVQELIEAYPYTSERYKAAVRIQCSADFAFVGVRQQWLFVLRNLLDNAFTALFSAGLRPQPGDVQIDITVDKGIGRIRFSDKGIGLEPRHLPDVFEPFDAWGKYAGLGLGLSYCQAVAQGAGGRIAMRSGGIGGGCKVQISLPLVQAQPAGARP